MLFLSLLVFTNLLLIPLVFHPLNICRHFIHIGHEPFDPERLQTHSYEFYLYNRMEHPRALFSIDPFIQKATILQRLYNFLFQTHSNLSEKYFYPNLLQYTRLYISDHDLSPFIHSFLSMYLSYFLLTYFSSLVHVYRLSLKRKQTSSEEIRSCAQQLMQSSYLRWIIDALFWKFLGVIISHVFYLMAVKILMQRLFMSYEHFDLKEELIYSSWNLPKNIQLAYEYEGWTLFFSGIVPRMIYELGITLLPRLIWWPFRSLFFHSTVTSYFHASSIELYFIQCICENILRCFSVSLQIFARLTTLEIVNQMHEHINLTKYPLLSLLRHHHHHRKQPWSFLLSTHLIDPQLTTKGLSIFFRQAN